MFNLPGGNKWIRPASTTEINKYPDIAWHFLVHVLDLEPEHTFISDLSSVDNFMIEYEVVERETFLHYGIEIADIKDGNLAAIFKRIAEEGFRPR